MLVALGLAWAQLADVPAQQSSADSMPVDVDRGAAGLTRWLHTLIVQYNLQEFDQNYGPYRFKLGNNPQKVVDEGSKVQFLNPDSPVFTGPNHITETDFSG